MWIILSKLFGWDYVFIQNTATEKIVRVKIGPDERRWFQPYYFQVNPIKEKLPLDGETIGGWKVIPLTAGITQYKGE